MGQSIKTPQHLYFCKVLQFKGRKALHDMIANAELYPIRGLFQFCDYEKDIDDYYHERSGNERGVSTGWKSLDALYRVCKSFAHHH